MKIAEADVLHDHTVNRSFFDLLFQDVQSSPIITIHAWTIVMSQVPLGEFKNRIPVYTDLVGVETRAETQIVSHNKRFDPSITRTKPMSSFGTAHEH